jgi:hypothetical protein
MSYFARHLLCTETEMQGFSLTFFAEQVFSGTPFSLGCNVKYDNYLPAAAFVVGAAYDTG